MDKQLKINFVWIVGSILLLILSTNTLFAQDIEEVINRTSDRIKDKPITVHGGINLNGTYADYSGPQPRFDTYGFNVGANLNFDILGVNAPFSLFFADKNLLYRLPSYQFAGVSPSYKWAKIHLGDRNLNFSDYTFSGQTFRGVGLELTPKQWTVRAMAGRLRYQSLFDIGARSGLEEAYRRMGYGGEVGYRANRWGVKAIVFAAEDQLPDNGVPTSIGVAPAQNLVTSLLADVEVIQNVRLTGEFARSFLSADLLSPAVPDSIELPFQPLSNKLSTGSADAFKIGLKHKIFRGGYERIDAGYRSLGTLFLQNDRDNITAGATFPVRFGTKSNQDNTASPWTLSMDGGVERNGISDNSIDQGRRLIARVLANGAIGKRMVVNASFSNFALTSRLRGFLDPGTSTDSVFLAQVNRQAQLGASLTPVEGVAGVLTGQLSLTDVSTLRDGVLDGFGSTITSTFLSWARQYAESGFGYSIQGLFAVTSAGPASQQTYGPSASVSQRMLDDKLLLNLSGAITFVKLTELDQENRVLNVQPNASYDLDQFGRITLAYTHTSRSLAVQSNFSENLLSLRYGWSF